MDFWEYQLFAAKSRDIERTLLRIVKDLKVYLGVCEEHAHNVYLVMFRGQVKRWTKPTNPVDIQLGLGDEEIDHRGVIGLHGQDKRRKAVVSVLSHVSTFVE